MKNKGKLIVMSLPIIICFVYVLWASCNFETDNLMELEIKKSILRQQKFRNFDSTLKADFVIERIQSSSSLLVIKNVNESITISGDTDNWLRDFDISFRALSSYYETERDELNFNVEDGIASLTLQINDRGAIENLPLIFLNRENK